MNVTNVLDELMGFNKTNSSNSSNILKELMEAEMANNNNNNNNIDNIDVFKDIVAGLDEKIRMLTEDINFLRRDAESKNNIISQLTQIIANGGDIRMRTNKHSDSSDAAYNINVSGYNSEVSKYNRENEDNHNGPVLQNDSVNKTDSIASGISVQSSNDDNEKLRNWWSMTRHMRVLKLVILGPKRTNPSVCKYKTTRKPKKKFIIYEKQQKI